MTLSPMLNVSQVFQGSGGLGWLRGGEGPGIRGSAGQRMAGRQEIKALPVTGIAAKVGAGGGRNLAPLSTPKLMWDYSNMAVFAAGG